MLAAVGTRVRFHGLQGRADLNGTTGHVLQWDAQGGRWAVECEATQENVRVRTANLTALGEGSEGGEGGEGPRECTPLLGGYAEEFVWVQVDDLYTFISLTLYTLYFVALSFLILYSRESMTSRGPASTII